MVLSVTYTDHVHGESDQLEIQVEDRDGRWRRSWLPVEGDRIELLIGYETEPLLPCGSFEVDEIEAAGPPDTVSIRALASGPIPDYRTRRSVAYEGQTLAAIAQAVAGRHGLTLVGEIRDIRVERTTQDREDDLTFLTRLAEAYGYVFSIRGERLVFYELATLEEAETTFTVRRSEVTRYQLKTGTRKVYRACEVSYDDPVTKQTIRRTVEAEGILTGDIFKLTTRVETAAQADEQARATLRRLNRRRVEGLLTVQGDPRLVAGSNGTLEGFGQMDGKYNVASSTHRLTRVAGYETTVDIKAAD